MTNKTLRKQVIFFTATGAALLCALTVSSSHAYNESDDEYRNRRQQNQLLDEEKALLRASDELSRRVFDYQRDIREIEKKMNATQINSTPSAIASSQSE